MRRPFLLRPGVALATLLSAAGLAAMVAGCELVAGIEDLQITGTDADVFEASTETPDNEASGTGLGSNDATTGESSPDAAADGANAGEVGSDAGAPSDGTVPGDGAVASGDGTIAADAAEGAPSTTEGSLDSSVDGGAVEGADNEAGAVSDDGSDGALPLQLIDNLESDTGHIPEIQGRSGSWFTYNDGTDGGVQSPPPPFLPAPTTPPLGSSVYSAETTGSGFAVFAGMGFTLNDPPTGPDAGVVSPYDASAYLGIVFDARVGTGSATRLRVAFPDINTASPEDSPFGEFFALTTQWTQYEVIFSSTTQENFGPQFAQLDTANIYKVIFQIDATSSPIAFDLWVDNIYFITR